MSIIREWRTFKAIFVRNIKLFTAYKAWVIATVIWPIPLLALNILQWGLFGPLGEVSETLKQSGFPPLAGTIIVGTIVICSIIGFSGEPACRFKVRDGWEP